MRILYAQEYVCLALDVICSKLWYFLGISKIWILRVLGLLYATSYVVSIALEGSSPVWLGLLFLIVLFHSGEERTAKLPVMTQNQKILAVRQSFLLASIRTIVLTILLILLLASVREETEITSVVCQITWILYLFTTDTFLSFDPPKKWSLPRFSFGSPKLAMQKI